MTVTTRTDTTNIDEDELCVRISTVVERCSGMPFQTFTAELVLPDCDAGDEGLDAAPAVVGRATMHVLPYGDWDELLAGADAYGGDLCGAVASLAASGADTFESWGPVLFIDSVVLDPSYRGADLSLGFVRDIVRTLCHGYSGVVLQPAPVPGEGSGEAGCTQASERLANHWGKLGFVPLADGVHGVDLARRGPLVD